jgi:hypothetical protein
MFWRNEKSLIWTSTLRFSAEQDVRRRESGRVERVDRDAVRVGGLDDLEVLRVHVEVELLHRRGRVLELRPDRLEQLVPPDAGNPSET